MDFAYGNGVREGDRFTLGTLELSVIETPGHTEESITLVLVDTEVSREPYMVFSGDTLFSGDIARTDFFGPERKAEMAEKMYENITRKILPLGDGAILCPAHGAGSSCGSEIADHPFSTIGYEKRTNPVLALGKEAFVARRTTESPYLPPYFRQMETVNREGPALLHSLPLYTPAFGRGSKEPCQIRQPDRRHPFPYGFCRRPHPGQFFNLAGRHCIVCRLVP